MALVLYGNGVADMRGSVGGNVYSRNRAGAIIRNRTKPIATPTARQAYVRNLFAQVVSNAQTLNAQTVEAWAEWAMTQTRTNALGQEYIPQGSQLYIETNFNLALIGQPEQVEPPIEKPFPPTIGGITLTGEFDEGVISTLVLDPLEPPDEGYFAIEATLPHSPLRRNNQKYFRQISIVEHSDTPISILAAYKNYFAGGGNVPYGAGQIINVRLRAIGLNGLSSDWVYDDNSLEAAP